MFLGSGEISVRISRSTAGNRMNRTRCELIASRASVLGLPQCRTATLSRPSLGRRSATGWTWWAAFGVNVDPRWHPPSSKDNPVCWTPWFVGLHRFHVTTHSEIRSLHHELRAETQEDHRCGTSQRNIMGGSQVQAVPDRTCTTTFSSQGKDIRPSASTWTQAVATAAHCIVATLADPTGSTLRTPAGRQPTR